MFVRMEGDLYIVDIEINGALEEIAAKRYSQLKTLVLRRYLVENKRGVPVVLETKLPEVNYYEQARPHTNVYPITGRRKHVTSDGRSR